MAVAARSAGFTFIELLIVLAIGGLLLVVAMPGYATWIAVYQARNQAEQLASSMNLARSEAVVRGQRVNLCPVAGGTRYVVAGNWANGWIVYVDDDHDGDAGTAESILRIERPATPGVRISSNRPLADYVSFTPLGNARLVSGGLQMGTFTVCRSGQPALKVILANSGRVRLDKTSEVCS